jgi:hypothetical protein
MFIECQTPGHEHPVNQWTAGIALWTCTSPTGKTTRTCCLDCTVEREMKGWTSERILTVDDILAAEPWGAGVGMN